MKNELYAKWGLVLGRVSRETGTTKKDLHRRIIKALGRTSLTEFTIGELKDLIDELVAYMASEWGVEFYFDREKCQEMAEMNLSELFEYYKTKKL